MPPCGTHEAVLHPLNRMPVILDNEKKMPEYQEFIVIPSYTVCVRKALSLIPITADLNGVPFQVCPHAH